MDASEFNLVGGTVVPGRIYLSTQKGRLYAIGSQESKTAQSDTIKASGEFIFGSQNTGPDTGDYSTLLQDETGFSGMFTVSNEGILYVSSENKILYALNLATNTYKTFTLQERSEGSPVLSEDGFIYIVSRTGGLTKLTQKGEIIWHFQSPVGNITFNSPSIGPDGTIYYVVQHGSTGFMQAVSPEGKDLWATQLNTGKYFVAPQVTPDGLYIFIQNDIVSIGKEELLDIEIDENIMQFIVGEDNKTYYVSAQSIVQVQVTPMGLIPLEKAAFAEGDSNASNYGIRDAGSTEQGFIWMAEWSGISLFEPDGKAVGLLRATRLITIDREGTIYILSGTGGIRGFPVIGVADLDTLEISWGESIDVDLGHYWITDTKGTLINGKLYLFFPGGSIVVVGDGSLEPATPE